MTSFLFSLSDAKVTKTSETAKCFGGFLKFICSCGRALLPDKSPHYCGNRVSWLLDEIEVFLIVEASGNAALDCFVR